MFKKLRKLLILAALALIVTGYFVYPAKYIAVKDKAVALARDFITAIKSPDKNFNFRGLSKDLDDIAQSIDDVATPIGEKVGEVAGQASEYIDEKVEKLKEKVKEKTSSLVKARLAKVVDGDTIRVIVDGSEVKVRLLSINAEESVHSDASRNNEYGAAASDWLKERMDSVEDVWLEYDREKQDQYGRELCYVWLSDDVDTEDEEDIEKYMLNAILLEEGYVYVSIYMPNNKNEQLFKALQEKARAAVTGLWQYEEFRNIVDSR